MEAPRETRTQRTRGCVEVGHVDLGREKIVLAIHVLISETESYSLWLRRKC